MDPHHRKFKFYPAPDWGWRLFPDTLYPSSSISFLAPPPASSFCYCFFFSMTHNIQTNKQKSLFPNNPMFWLPPPTQREQGIGAPLRTLHLPKRCYPPPQPLIQLGTPGSCMSKSLKEFNTIILKMQLFLL